MPPKAGVPLLRMVFVILIGGLIAFASLPDAARGHAENSDSPYAGHEAVKDIDHHAEVATSFGHCHPGLDCFTAAAFLLTPVLPGPAGSGKTKTWLAGLEGESWTPLSDKPPPRHQS